MIESQPLSIEGLTKEELQIRRRQAAITFFDTLMRGEQDAAVIVKNAQSDPDYMDQVIDHLDAFTGIRLGIQIPGITEPEIDPDILNEYSRLMNNLDHMLGIVQ